MACYLQYPWKHVCFIVWLTDQGWSVENMTNFGNGLTATNLGNNLNWQNSHSPLPIGYYKYCSISLHLIFTFWEPTYSEDRGSLFYLKMAWVVVKLLYKIWSVLSSFIHSRQTAINSYTSILWNVITRGVMNSVCSPLVIHTLRLHRTSLSFSPSLFIKNNRIVPNFRWSYRWRSQNTFVLHNH